MVLEAEARIDEGVRAEALVDPTEPREGGGRHAETEAPPVQARLELEQPPHLGSVVLGDVGDDPGLEVRQPSRHDDAVRRLVPDETEGFRAVRKLRSIGRRLWSA